MYIKVKMHTYLIHDEAGDRFVAAAYKLRGNSLKAAKEKYGKIYYVGLREYDAEVKGETIDG